jgi:hypothetical protein
MSTQLTPPAVRPIPARTRQRIRNRILDTAQRPRRPKGWLAAIAAGAAVATIAIVGGQTLRSDDAPGPATTPATTPAGRPDPDAVVVDRGGLSAGQLRTAKQACLGGRNESATVLFARRVLWRPAPITPATVTSIVLQTSAGRYLACHDMDQVAAVGAPEPTAADPVRPFAQSGIATYYRVHPSVARLETRVTWQDQGKKTEWSVAVIRNGFAYALDDGVEIRAFDASGRELPLPDPYPTPPSTPTPTPSR